MSGAAVRLLALVAALALPSAARAQAPEPGRLVAGVTTAATPALQPPAVPRRSAGLQMVGGVIGAYGGALGGALLGSAVLPRTQCGDDPGLCEAATGAVVGIVVGAAVGAALPSGGDRCGFGRRTLYGLGGGVLGFAAGIAAAAIGPPIGIVTVPVGTGIGAGLAAWACG